MADVINRQSAINALHEWELLYDWDQTCRENRERVYAPSDAIEALPDEEPEVVRCKDCKYWPYTPTSWWSQDKYMTTYQWCDSIGHHDGNGFCSKGERRTDG